MTVSVVVPVYDHEHYVAQCLASIDAQDHEDLEVIVVDDGSRDRSWDRIQSVSWRRLRRVRTLRTVNAGAHAAINRGLDLATGEWVAICNSDDLFAPSRLSTLLAAAEAASTRFVFSGVRYVNDTSADVTDTLPFAQELQRTQRAIPSFPSVGFALLTCNVAISTGNFFFARSLVTQIGYFRPYRYVHDWDFILRALLVTEPLYSSRAALPLPSAWRELVPAPQVGQRGGVPATHAPLHARGDHRALAEQSRAIAAQLAPVLRSLHRGTAVRAVISSPGKAWTGSCTDRTERPRPTTPPRPSAHHPLRQAERLTPATGAPAEAGAASIPVLTGILVARSGFGEQFNCASRPDELEAIHQRM